MASTIYGDITPRTAAYAVDKMLERAQPMLNMAKFAVVTSVPKGRTKVVKWRRYARLAPTTSALSEGVTPTINNLTSTDVTATLAQYGQVVGLSDFIMDTHEDPVLGEFSSSMGETAGQTLEAIIYSIIKAGSQVQFSNTSLRTTVNTAINSTTVRKAIRQLKQQDTKMLTSMLNASDGVGTSPIPPSYVCFCHPNIEMDLQNTSNFASGFTRVQQYGTFKPISDAEIGSFENIRFVGSTLYTPFANAATGTTLNAMLSTGGTYADVYASIVVGKDAYATVNLAGSGNGLTPVVVNPKPSDSDPLGQRGYVGFKMYATAAILNDAWMTRIEHAVTA
jgi:N4-gp56 family major capsid protein